MMEFDNNQREAITKMRSGSILVGGVGSGKSRTALMYFFNKECNGKVIFENGMATLIFPAPNLKKLYVITTAAKRDKKEWEKEMIPFQLEAVVDSWNNIGKYVDVENAFIIFDEQRVVGSGAWSKSFLKIAKKNDWILLSATPGDTWKDYVPVFVANGFYKNRTQFYNRHVIWSRYTTYPKIDRYVEEDRLEKLKSIILIEMDVNKKTTPHKIIFKPDYDSEMYSKITKDRWNFYDDVPIENAPQYMSLIRRVVNSDPSRCKKILEIIKDRRKVIIFYNFDYERDLLLKLAHDNEITVAEWNGHNHEPIPSYSEEWIYLVQYNAGSEGWECIETDTIIFYSLSYSYRMMKQASGRIDRRNTSFKDLYYYYMISDSKIDKAISQSLSQKKDFNEKRFYEKYEPSIFTALLIEEEDK